MKTTERRKLEKDMFDAANKISDNVGPDIGKDFSELFKKGCIAWFCLHRESPEYSEIMDTWEKWIKSYCFFKKLDVPESAPPLLDNPKLVLRWLTKPEVLVEGLYDEQIINNPNDEHWRDWKGGKPDIENPRYFRIRAYLSIYRIDFRATGIERNATPRVLPDKG